MWRSKRIPIIRTGLLGPLALAVTSVVAPQPGVSAEHGSSDAAWGVTIGGGAVHRPDYDGSDDYETDFLPRIGVSYRDIVFLQGPNLSVDVLALGGARRAENLSFGPRVRYDAGRDRSQNRILGRLGDVRGGVEAGLFAEYDLGRLALLLDVRQDVGDRHDGLVAEVGVGYAAPLAARWLAAVEARATWANDEYSQAYFGITREQSLASGLRRYEAGGGMKDASVSLSLSYGLTAHWTISGLLTHRALLGDAADSPLVADHGSRTQHTAALLASYAF